MDPAQTPDDPEDPDQQPRPTAPPRQPPHEAALQSGAPPASFALPNLTGAAGPRLAMAPPLQPDHRLFTPAFVRVLGMQAAYGFSFSLFFLLPKYLATLGESPARIGFVMGGFGVACILTIPFLAPLVTRLGR
ncbi:MAG: hypothetical protein ABJA82_13465, partial [Myxococcales bacterium]